jgi:hypothetical protein
MGKHMWYPYDEWADGKERVAVWGVDYTCKTNSFIATVHGYANRHFLRFTVIDVYYNLDEGRVTFRLERQFRDV